MTCKQYVFTLSLNEKNVIPRKWKVKSKEACEKFLERKVVIPQKPVENFYKIHVECLRKQRGNYLNLQEKISGQHTENF